MKLNFFNSTKSIIIGEEKIRPSGLLINYSPIVYRLFTVSIIVYFELEKRAFAVKSWSDFKQLNAIWFDLCINIVEWGK